MQRYLLGKEFKINLAVKSKPSLEYFCKKALSHGQETGCFVFELNLLVCN
jgi:hypothetical protein